jgi:hypothetical protein
MLEKEKDFSDDEECGQWESETNTPTLKAKDMTLILYQEKASTTRKSLGPVDKVDTPNPRWYINMDAVLMYA